MLYHVCIPGWIQLYYIILYSSLYQSPGPQIRIKRTNILHLG